MLERAGLADAPQRQRLGSVEDLQRGREVLLDQCLQCHDLRAVLINPRTPPNSRATLERMANRSTFGAPIDDDDQWRVTAYLIAISPTLQKTVQLERQQQQASSQAHLAVHDAQNRSDDYDPASAREVFEVLCSQCHDLADVDAHRPRPRRNCTS